MEPVGRDLKAIREKKNVTLREIANATRINLTYLKGLEEGSYDSLPGGIYNRAFLRAYCEFLGLEPQGYLDRYETEMTPPAEKLAKTKPRVVNTQGPELRLHPLVIWGAMLLVSVVGLFFSRHWIASVFSPYFSRSPASRITPQEPTALKTAPLQTVTPTAAVIPDAAAPPTRETPGSTPAAEASVRIPSKTFVPPAQAPGTIRLEFHVMQKCWVSVNSDGNRVLNRLLEPGDDQFFDATQRFYLIIGNAGGIRLKINGKPAKLLGKPGDVVRLIVNEQNLPDLLEKSTG